MRALISGSIAAAHLLACAPSAAAQDQDPDWRRRPTPESLFALFPPDAYRRGINGKATIECIVTVQGTLRACKVLSETPPGAGFGAAGLALTPQFLMKPQIRNGQAVEGTVQIPLNWRMPDGGVGISGGVRDRVYARLPFSKAPTHAEVLAAYPAKARSAKVGGIVTMNCRIRDEGKLGDCETIREEPKGYGFAPAARSLGPSFVGPFMDDGKSIVGARATVVVTFAASSLNEASPVIGKPQWVQVPRINDMEAVLPPAAKKAGVYKARVVMTCRVVDGGAVEACKAENEEPKDLGFGAAAESLAKYFRLSVWTDEGLPTVGGSVRVPLRFEFQPPAAPAAKPGG